MKLSKLYRPELVVSKDPERYNLTDPWLDAQEERVVSTDGHALVALPVQIENGERSRYLAVQLLKAARMLGAEDAPAEIEDQEIKPFGVLWPAEQMGREFPQWRAALPSFARGDAGTVTFALNSRLLKGIADAMAEHVVALTIQLGRTEEDPSPILVQPISPRAKELGLLMPWRADGAGETKLGPGQVCPECGKVLAAGAWCPEHGNPLRPPTNGEQHAPEPTNGAPVMSEADLAKLMGTREEAIEPHAARTGGPAGLFWAKGEEPFTQSASVADGRYELAEKVGSGLWCARWIPSKGKPKVLAAQATQAVATKACEQHHIERRADAILANAGAGELNRKDTTGPAARHRKAHAPGVRTP